jgi:hypothetical protein
MEQYTHTCVAHIAGRLIAGKGVTSMYDYYQSLEIEAIGLPNNKCLTEFHYINWNCLSDPPGISYQCRYKAGNSIDIASRGISSSDIFGRVPRILSEPSAVTQSTSTFINNQPISTSGSPENRLTNKTAIRSPGSNHLKKNRMFLVANYRILYDFNVVGQSIFLKKIREARFI